MVSAIESVTVGVQDLEAAVAGFRKRLRLNLVRDTCVSVGLLAAWQRPVHESVRLIELGGPNHAFGHVRLAHFECGGPAAAGEDAIVLGPRRLAEPVATVAIVIEDPGASQRFYVEGFGWHAVGEVADDAVELFGGEPVRLTGFSAPEGAVIDVLLGHFPNRAVSRLPAASMPGRLGINLCTCRCDDLDAVEQRLATIGIEPVTRPTHVGLPIGRPGRVMLVRGPADELFELVELAD